MAAFSCTHIKFSTPKKLDESPHKITAPVKEAGAEVAIEAQDHTESLDEMYEVVEMQVTSSAKARYAPAQMSQEGSQHVESEASKDSAAQEENQETYVNFD